jgi:hypothetical protein
MARELEEEQGTGAQGFDTLFNKRDFAAGDSVTEIHST